MPEEKNTLRPDVDAEQWAGIKALTHRDTIAARVLMSRHVTGIPRRPFLLGECDHAPMLKGMEEFAGAVWLLIDALNDIQPPGMPASVEDAASAIISFMEDLPA